MSKDDDSKQLGEWLASPQQHTSHELKQPDSRITIKEVRELFSWLKNRITGSSIDSKDRQLFNDWIVQRVTDHPTVDRDEFHKIKRDLLDS